MNPLTSVNLNEGLKTILTNSFYNCTSLKRIIGGSGVQELNKESFYGINKECIIDVLASFTIVVQNNGVSIDGLSKGKTYSFLNGEKTFSAPSSWYFADKEKSKTIVLQNTGKIEDITERLKICFVDVDVTSSRDDTKFYVSYTLSDGTEKNTELFIGRNVVDIQPGMSVVFSGLDTLDEQCSSFSQTVNYAPVEAKFVYKERIYKYIRHKNGTVYTKEEWVSNNYLSEDADGVCLIGYTTGGFVMAKKPLEPYYKWSNVSSLVEGISDNSSSYEDGYGDTQKIISHYGTGGAPAAEACVEYTFPSGKNGYLPSTYNLSRYSSNRTDVDDIMDVIGGRKWGTGSGITIWSSSQYSNSQAYCWHSGMNGISYETKTNARFTWPCAPYGMLRINANLNTSYRVEYTNIQGLLVERAVSAGVHNFNVKYGTQMTVSPIGNLGAEPVSFVFNQDIHELSFTYAKDAGVYIQHVNGSLHTEAEWTAGGYSNNDANGVAVISETFPSFVISPKKIISFAEWGGYGKTVSGILTGTSESYALTDYDGYGNTPKIIKQCAGYTNNYITGAPAAEACADYIFPNGAKGYLPALGEWAAAHANKSAIDSAISLIGGEAITAGYLSSSTQYDSSKHWGLVWQASGTKGSLYKYSSYPVRAFTLI